jgi:hypothetical protein
MATCPAEWRRAKQFKIDGVTYDICVAPKGGQYKSAWVCTRCIEQGPIDQTWSTREEAAARAEIGLRIHHAFVHGGPLPRKALTLGGEGVAGPPAARQST